MYMCTYMCMYVWYHMHLVCARSISHHIHQHRNIHSVMYTCNIYIYTYICTHTHIYIYIHIYFHIYIFISIYIYIYIYVCVSLVTGHSIRQNISRENLHTEPGQWLSRAWIVWIARIQRSRRRERFPRGPGDGPDWLVVDLLMSWW